MIYYLSLYFYLSYQASERKKIIEEMEIYTRELKRELKNTETDRDLWKNRYIRCSMGDGTTIERAVIERDNWQHKYESEAECKYTYI